MIGRLARYLGVTPKYLSRYSQISAAATLSVLAATLAEPAASLMGEVNYGKRS